MWLPVSSQLLSTLKATSDKLKKKRTCVCSFALWKYVCMLTTRDYFTYFILYTRLSEYSKSLNKQEWLRLQTEKRRLPTTWPSSTSCEWPWSFPPSSGRWAASHGSLARCCLRSQSHGSPSLGSRSRTGQTWCSRSTLVSEPVWWTEENTQICEHYTCQTIWRPQLTTCP